MLILYNLIMMRPDIFFFLEHIRLVLTHTHTHFFYGTQNRHMRYIASFGKNTLNFRTHTKKKNVEKTQNQNITFLIKTKEDD